MVAFADAGGAERSLFYREAGEHPWGAAGSLNVSGQPSRAAAASSVSTELKPPWMSARWIPHSSSNSAIRSTA